MQQQEENIPIDIHYNKLGEWLVSRHHCKKHWKPATLQIGEKINAAIQDMPEHPEIIELLKGTYINYFHCLRIVEILKETEKASKNIFGSYSSKRMKDWQEIVKLYEEDGIYIAEVAQMLEQNVKYEIPALKKQVAKCQQIQRDCTRKESEHASNAAQMRESYYQQCKQLGIQGKKVKSELVALVKDLPATFEEIGRSTGKLQPAIKYYQDFLQYTLSGEVDTAEVLQVLRHVSAKGNTTTYEYRHGEAPDSVDQVLLNFKGLEEEEEEREDDKPAEIDFGDLDDEIDFGADTEGAETIEDGGDVEIDWGGEEIAVVADDTGVQDVTMATSDKVARGTDALTILDNPELRVCFINELLELSDFLETRVTELGDNSNVLSGNDSMSGGDGGGRDVGIEEAQTMVCDVNAILSQLTTGRLKDLLPIRSSPRYVDRLADRLKKVLSDAEKMLSLSSLMVKSRQEALAEEKATEPKIDLLRKRTMELKTQIAGEISKKYKGRRVNIMGEVNTV